MNKDYKLTISTLTENNSHVLSLIMASSYLLGLVESEELDKIVWSIKTRLLEIYKAQEDLGYLPNDLIDERRDIRTSLLELGKDILPEDDFNELRGCI